MRKLVCEYALEGFVLADDIVAEVRKASLQLSGAATQFESDGQSG